MDFLTYTISKYSKPKRLRIMAWLHGRHPGFSTNEALLNFLIENHDIKLYGQLINQEMREGNI